MMILSIGFIAVYVVLVGFASFIEVPVGRGLSAFQLNFLIRVGSLTAALVALFVVHRFSLPSASSTLAGLGIGLITGVGSIFYCLALKYMRVSLVVTFANLYLVITILLGIIVLQEPVSALKVAGFAATLAGVAVLSQAPIRYGVNPEPRSDVRVVPTRSFFIIAAYTVIVGAGAFLEKPALKGLDPTELNALMAIAMTAVAGIALGLQGPRLPIANRALKGTGVGAMIGIGSVFYFLGLRGLPVSVAAAAANASVVVTVLLSALVLRQSLTRARSSGLALTLLGVTLLALSAA